MLKSFVDFGAVALIALGVALGGSSATAESVMKQCGDRWQAAKTNGTTNGQTWPQFLSQCRAQLNVVGVAPSPVAAPPPAPTMHTIPALPPTQLGQVPAPTAVPAATGADQFASEQQARARCPRDTVVWVNTLSHVYHYSGVSSHGHSYYGNTAEGAYMCEADAKAAGNRAAKDERHH